MFTAGAQLGFVQAVGELEPKDQVIPKNVALGRRAKQRGLIYAHHKRGMAVEPQAAGQLSFLFFIKKFAV